MQVINLTKTKKMCPFCRCKYNSMAPNLSLQNLVQMANDNSLGILTITELRIRREVVKKEGVVREKIIEEEMAQKPDDDEPEYREERWIRVEAPARCWQNVNLRCSLCD